MINSALPPVNVNPKPSISWNCFVSSISIWLEVADDDENWIELFCFFNKTDWSAFVNENGKIVVVVMNQSSKPMDYSLWIQGQAVKMNAEANSIKSIIIS